MDRLRNLRGSTDPTLARAARLVSARDPLGDDEARKQRVRARLRRRRASPRLLGALRVAMLLLLTCTVAAASAMIGRVAQSIIARVHATKAGKTAATHATAHHRRAGGPALATDAPEPAPAVAPAPAAAPAAAAPALTAPVAALAATAPVVAPPVVGVAGDAPSSIAAPSSAAPHVARPFAAASHAAAAPLRTLATTPPVDSTRGAADGADSDEQRLLSAAVRALRHEHDPARAATLLSRYLDRYPDGVAAEDAVALALEATLGRDRPQAAAFATRYLARHPSGRWSALARRALEP